MPPANASMLIRNTTYLVPAGSMQTVSIPPTTTASAFSAFPTTCTHILMTHETAAIRFTIDGSTPTTAAGLLANVGDIAGWVVSADFAAAMKFVPAGTNSTASIVASPLQAA